MANTRDNFTDQKPHVATAQDLKRPFGGKRDGSRFRCYLCGHQFIEGDIYRWVYSNATPYAGGNPFVCSACDEGNERVIDRWRKKHAEWIRMKRGEWWWFAAHDEEQIRG